MGIIRFAIENPVKIAVMVILMVLFGLMSIAALPIQLTPDVDRPVITVSTVWRGASPQEIESEIIDRQEDKLKSVTNLKKMTSSSNEGQGVVRLEFPVGVNKDIAYRDVSDKLRQVSDYPDEVDEPVMSATDDEMGNVIAWMILSGREGEDIAPFKTFVEDQVKPILERAEGISEVNVYGGLDREIHIEIDPYKLAGRGITFRQVEQALRRQNENISAGNIALGKRDYTYRTVGEYTSLKEIEDTVIAYQSGGPVVVKDVARVVDGFKKQAGFVRSKGRFVIALPARRETGANVITAIENLKERIAAVNRDILAPRGMGLELTQVYDETAYIWSAVRLVVDNIFEGGLLAVIVLWLFLRSFSATGIIAVTIPLSVIGAFLIITLMGRSLNVIMLAGMAFAVGNSVDNAIVVLENIYRHRGMGKSKLQAAMDGAQEVWGAVFASTLTTAVVYLPVIFMQEEAGQLFRDISIASVAAAVLSLAVSIVVIPPLASRYFTASKATGIDANKPWAVADWASRIVAAINRRFSLRLATVVGLTGAAFAASWWFAPPAEYLPNGNKNLVFGFIFSPPGYSMEEFRRMATIVEDGDPSNPHDGARPAWEAELGSAEAALLPPVDIKVGTRGDRRRIIPPPIENFFYVGFNSMAFMGCTSKDSLNVKPLEDVMTNIGQRLPGVFTFFTQTSLFSSGGISSGNSVDIEVRGDDHDAVIASASAILGAVMAEGFEYPSPDPANFAQGRPELQIIPDREKAADLGLNVTDLGFIVEASVEGAFVGEYNDRGDRIDMALTVAGGQEASPEQVTQTPIHTPAGKVVPLSSVVRVRRTTAPQQINHIEEMDSVTLAVKPKTGVALQETMRQIEEEIIAPMRASGAIPPHVITALAGTADKLTETTRALVGDFRGVITRPHLAELSVGLSMLLVTVVAAMIVVGAGLLWGPRRAVKTGLGLGALVALGFLAINPALALMVFQSRVVLALLVTYLLMAALFESFIYPLVIMFAVPPAVIGGILGLRMVHQISLYDVTMPVQQLDVLTMLGFIILIGIVVNNAILLIHQALWYMNRDGMGHDAAVVLAVRTRTRPIFMTALTSVIGMLPLVVMPGAGSELYRGLGSVMVGGLLLSTSFTLMVVPAAFSLAMEFRAWLMTGIDSLVPVSAAGVAANATAQTTSEP